MGCAIGVCFEEVFFDCGREWMSGEKLDSGVGSYPFTQHPKMIYQKSVEQIVD
jgi:hypothetical protein